MTNHEKITAPLQTAQGLAEFLTGMDDNWCIYCGNQDQCNILIDADENISDEYCVRNIAKWLESEAK